MCLLNFMSSTSHNSEGHEKKTSTSASDVFQLEANASPELIRLLKKSEISLWLDTYDDIFSDFDPRPYSQRALSDDFLEEARKVAREKKEGDLELRFLIPQKERDPSKEVLIRERVRSHFKVSYTKGLQDYRKFLRSAFLFTVVGVVLQSLAVLVHNWEGVNVFSDFFLIMLEPSGWFAMWTGLDMLFRESRKEKQKLAYFEKMANVKVRFDIY